MINQCRCKIIVVRRILNILFEYIQYFSLTHVKILSYFMNVVVLSCKLRCYKSNEGTRVRWRLWYWYRNRMHMVLMDLSYDLLPRVLTVLRLQLLSQLIGHFFVSIHLALLFKQTLHLSSQDIVLRLFGYISSRWWWHVLIIASSSSSSLPSSLASL